MQIGQRVLQAAIIPKDWDKVKLEDQKLQWEKRAAKPPMRPSTQEKPRRELLPPDDPRVRASKAIWGSFTKKSKKRK